MIKEPPDTERLYAPLRELPAGVCLRFFRDRGGQRCAVGFTSLERLTSLLGAEQRYYRLTEHAIRELAADRDVSVLVVDPGLVAAPVREHGAAVQSIDHEAAQVIAAAQAPTATAPTTAPAAPAPAIPSASVGVAALVWQAL
ncbi:MAG TPA: SAV_915 family protein [Actinocrinis sp.]